MDNDTILLSDAAKIAGVTTSLLRRAARNGELNAVKISEKVWAVKRADLDAWINDAEKHNRGRRKTATKA